MTEHPPAVQIPFPALPAHAADVMFIFGFPQGLDCHDQLWWRADESGAMTLFANCSDLFMWATADIEPILPEDLPLLERAAADVKYHMVPWLLPDLYACRKRRLSPMTSWLDKHAEPAALRYLFTSCGPQVVDPLSLAPKDVPEEPTPENGPCEACVNGRCDWCHGLARNDDPQSTQPRTQCWCYDQTPEQHENG